MPKPSKLYKYKAFDQDSLELILSDYLYYANPSQFNDPLDCKISIVDDINDEDELKNILSKLYKSRAEKRLNEAAKSLHYRGNKTLEKISTLSQNEVEKMIYDIYTNFSFFGDEGSTITEALANAIGSLILSGYNKGVLSLSEDGSCPLMWSHYAEDHKGLCLGYNVPEMAKKNVRPIIYTSDSREVRTSQILKMINNDNSARRAIEESIFLRKASPWAYEKEWRMISNVGLQNASLYLSEITFGLRCKDTTIYSIMKSLHDRERPIDFYQIVEVPKKFTLKKEKINFDNEKIHGLPRCMEEIDLMINEL